MLFSFVVVFYGVFLLLFNGCVNAGDSVTNII